MLAAPAEKSLRLETLSADSSTEGGKACQAMVDYHAGGNLMGISGEGVGGEPQDYAGTFVRCRDIRVRELAADDR